MGPGKVHAKKDLSLSLMSFKHVWIFMTRNSFNISNSNNSEIKICSRSSSKNYSLIQFPSNLSTCCFLLVFSLLLLPKSSYAADMTESSKLRLALLDGYDANSRPIQNHQNATIVSFNVYLKGFDFDEKRSLFTLYAWTVLQWKDAHMHWQPKEYGNISKIHFAANELWKPDLHVFNNLDKSEIDHFGNTRILVYNNTLVAWVPPTRLQVGCTSNLRQWPVDTHQCNIVIGSWAHDGSMLDIKLPTNRTTMDDSDLLKNREWTLLDNSLKKRVHFFGSVPGVPFPDILMTFTLAREGATHKAAIVVPGLAIAMGVLIAFWIQPGATERLVLILVCIMINVMYLNYIYRMLPNNGDSIPLVLLYYRDSLMMIAVALVWTICLRYLAASKRSSPVPLPGFIQSFLASLPAKILCLDPRPTTGTQTTANVRANNGENSTEGSTDSGKLVVSGNLYQEDWAWLAHLLDRVAFVLYLVIYFCFYIALL